MQQNKKQAFTLVELIVVIVVITILGTIAFISLQGYSASARDSKRVNDIQKIKTSLELFSLDTGKYPLPNNQTEATYSGTTIWTQGTIGDGVRTNLSRNLTKKPLDPLTDLEYTYSTTQKQTEYEILGVYETTEVFGYTNILNQTQAENQSYPKVDGTYNQVAVKTDKYIIPTPSIINAELPVDDEIQITQETINSQIVTGGDNGINNSTGELDITNFEVYEIPSDGEINESEVATIIQATYSGSTDLDDGIYAEIVNTEGEELISLIENTVLSSTIYSQTSTISAPLVVTNGECGTANKTYSYSDLDYGTDTFCLTGNTNPEIPKFPNEGEIINWDCEGINGGTTDNCSSTRTLTPINGECGTANNVATLTTPSSNLCSSGNPTSVTTNTTNFTWSCQGLNEGTSTSCSATRQFNVTFNANGGTLGTTSVVATYGLSMPTLATAPTRNGYTFNGYFSTTSGGIKYYNTDKSSATIYSLTYNTTLYAQWTYTPYSACTSVGEIKIATTKYNGCDTYDIIVCSGVNSGYTIAACNVGTTTSGTTSTSYGNYFQWGNNHAGYNGGNTTSTLANISSSFSPPPYYSSSSFIIGSSSYRYDWTMTQNDNLWGYENFINSGSNDYTLIQGPCEEGYHIPTQNEWAGLIGAGNWGNNGILMSNTIKLPISGTLSRNGGTLASEEVNARYWSVTPSNNNTAYVYVLYFWNNTSSAIETNREDARSYGFTIRCFKN